MALYEVVTNNRCYGGDQLVCSHDSSVLKCKMKFSIYLPPKSKDEKCPVLYFLSGLTCDEQVFINKGGAQRAAATYDLIIVGPDTSPRGKLIPLYVYMFIRHLYIIVFFSLICI